MKGPDYPFFELLAGYLSGKFCDRCEASCWVYGNPASEKCLHHAKWQGIFDDFDQLVSRVTESKPGIGAPK